MKASLIFEYKAFNAVKHTRAQTQKREFSSKYVNMDYVNQKLNVYIKC